MKKLVLATAITAGMTGAAFADDPLNDLEIAHAAYTAGQLDIRYAHMALALSENDAVRDFAATMIRDHTAVNDAAGALIVKLDVVPQNNPLSQALAEGAAAKRAEFVTLSGHVFDCAYATNELAYHQLVNETVAESFIPAVTVEPLRDLLAEALETFLAHEAHAGAMVEELQCG